MMRAILPHLLATALCFAALPVWALLVDVIQHLWSVS